MNDPALDRRVFLRWASASSLFLLLRDSMASVVGAVAPASAPRATFVRKNIASLTAAEIDSLRRGVRVMKARPAGDRTSWRYQANIHGTPTGSNLAWNTCQHGSFFFFPWHRMYLYFFERILRKASGDPNLTLPYWNYTDPSARALPLPFRQPANTQNSLFESLRAPGVNTGAQLPASATTFSAAFTLTNFASATGSSQNFGGQFVSQPVHFSGPHGKLESQPHDIIHGLIGGQNGLMGDPNTAARDPIFWLHHANIDRLWDLWLAQGGGRRDPTDISTWKTPKFTFFDENGNAVQMSGCEVINAQTQLGYTYEGEPAQVPQTCAAAVAGQVRSRAQRVIASGPAPRANAVPTPVELGPRPTSVSISLPEPARTEIRRATAAPTPDTTLVLNIEGIDYDRQPGIYYEIYINLPPGTTDPDPEGPNYVGNLAFFALKGHGHGAAADGAGPTQGYDITAKVNELKRLGRWQEGALSVTLVPRGLIQQGGNRRLAAPPAGRPRFRRISIVVEE